MTTLTRTVLYIIGAAAIIGAQDVDFLHVDTQTLVQESAVSIRFFLQYMSTGEPIPYLDADAFQAKAGAAQRVISSAGADDTSRMEGVLSQRNFGATIYLTLLLDMSMSVEPAQLKAVVSNFATTFMTVSRGSIYIKLVAFSGAENNLDLTATCGHEGFCNNADDLLRVIQSYETQLNTQHWPGYDHYSSNVWGSIENCADTLEVSAQAHADRQRQLTGTSPSAMAEYLVVFSDLDDSSEFSTVSQTVSKLQLAGRDQKVSFVVLDLPDDYAEQNPGAVQRISAAKSQLSSVVDQILPCQHADIQAQTSAFAGIAERYDATSNAYYEIRVCPPVRHGTNLPLILEMKDVEASATAGHFVPASGQLQTLFSAEGFGNTCPYQGARMQAQHTSFCAARSCGFSRGVFCGICRAPHDGTVHFDMQPDEAMVISADPPAAHSGYTKIISVVAKLDGVPVDKQPLLIAHVNDGDGSIERVAIHEGQRIHHGVSVHAAGAGVPTPTLSLSPSSSGVAQVLLHVSWFSEIWSEAIDQVEVTTTWLNVNEDVVDAPEQHLAAPVGTVRGATYGCLAFSLSGEVCTNGKCDTDVSTGEAYCACDSGWTGPRCTISSTVVTTTSESEFDWSDIGMVAVLVMMLCACGIFELNRRCTDGVKNPFGSG